MSGTISTAPAVPHRVFRIIKWFLTRISARFPFLVGRKGVRYLFAQAWEKVPDTFSDPTFSDPSNQKRSRISFAQTCFNCPASL